MRRSAESLSYQRTPLGVCVWLWLGATWHPRPSIGLAGDNEGIEKERLGCVRTTFKQGRCRFAQDLIRCTCSWDSARTILA